MARTTRSSQGASQSAVKIGTKRAAEPSSSPAAKRGKTSKEDQKTIEETMNGIENDKDVEMQINEEPEKKGAKDKEDGNREDELKAREDAMKKREDAVSKKEDDGSKDNKKIKDEKRDEKDSNGLQNGEKNAFDEVKANPSEVKEAAKEEQDSKTEKISSNNESVIEDPKREAGIPSSILEKGIIYFFFRGRVGVEAPQGIEDVARSYIVLRPLPLGTKIGEGPLQDDGNARMLALPKKMLPKGSQDKFLMFVEKAGAFIKDLKEQFAGNEYSTKTVG